MNLLDNLNPPSLQEFLNMNFLKNLNPPSSLQEFLNILPCASFNQDWLAIFNERYPQAWSKTEKHGESEIYMAAIRSNNNVNENIVEEHDNNAQEEDNEIVQVVHQELPSIQEHLEAQSLSDEFHLFLGIYDCGNGRKNEASLHLKHNLFIELERLVGQNDNHMSEDIIKRAFSHVEETFMQIVTDNYQNYQTRIEDGSCCIASFIWGRTLYIANLGDSRAVLGSKMGVSIFKRLHVEQLTNDHSLSNKDIREDLKALNPHDSDVVQYNEGIWKNKSNIKVNRSIGYAHLKDHPINSLPGSSHLGAQVLVSAKPELHSRKIRKGDRFLILASHGFWNFITNKNAANIVNRNPRNEIAKRLLSAALKEAAEKKGAKGVYDDMIIIVLFFSKDTPNTAALHEGPSYLSNWKFPDEGWIKLNCAGVQKKSRDLAGCGGLLRDSKGQWIQGYTSKLGNCTSLEEAEKYGMYQGLQLAIEKKVSRLIVESDSKLLIDMVTGRHKFNGDTPFLIRKIQDLISKVWQAQFQHTWREGNRSANWLANHSLIQESLDLIILEDPPIDLQSILFADISGASIPTTIIMASGKSDQSHQSPTSSIQNPQASVPTDTHRRVGSSIGREWDICLRSSEFRSDIHQSGQSEFDSMDAISRAVTNVIENLMKKYTLQSKDGEESSSSSHQLRQKDTSEMDQLMAISVNNTEIKKMLQGMQQVLKNVQQQQQQLLPVSAIQELEMIGKIVKLVNGTLTVEMEKSIFGYQFKDFINGNLMIEVARQEWLSNASMTFYVRYLHDEIIRPHELFNKFSFLSPHIMSWLVQNPYEGLDEEEKKNIATVFLESKDKLILAPCNLSQHYVLIVINVNADTIYYIDSLDSSPENYPNLVPNFQKTFEVYRKKSRVVPKSTKVNWKKPKCPKQPNENDCGYYVMKFMKDIIVKSPNEIPVDYVPEIEGDTYSNEVLDEVKTDWASYLINIIKTTKSSTAV